MSDVFRNLFRPSRIAGSLLVYSALLSWLFDGAFNAIAAALGIALCIVVDTSKLEMLRLLVFLWCAVMLVLAIAAAATVGEWLPFVRTVLLTGAIAGLMLNGLREATVAVLTLVAFGAITA